MSIDYARARRESPALKAALTRASRKPAGEPRQRAILEACFRNLEAWEGWGCWPDDWARLNRELADAFGFRAPDADELEGWRRDAAYYGSDPVDFAWERLERIGVTA